LISVQPAEADGTAGINGTTTRTSRRDGYTVGAV
jgi:hypothetical protein